ncbi:UTP--glucose-1-phosphate uridylyltransferase [Weissella viridescens]|uniref:UTP--glucose-1-phosphate uridylyltransferase n=1 Tax=Weissella viridescens TaxID=1629 RepID=A0A380NWB8_WEIVI|nr:UTP--glucose-1-phosphate uridylyltransferase [Weissella viridescens]
MAIIGRYLLTPEIFEELESTKPGKGGEVQLTDAIDSLNKRQQVDAHEFKGRRYDIGSKIGFLTTNVEFGLKHPQTGEALKAYIKELAKH